MNIILIGLKSSGKTSVGKQLAQQMHYDFIDTDQLLEAHYASILGKHSSLKEIYHHEGENYFRALETAVIRQMIPTHKTVIATGGGTLLNSANIQQLKKQGLFVYLHVSREIFQARLQAQVLPFVDTNNPHSIEHLYEQRTPIYHQAADIEIFTENKSISDLCTEVMTIMEQKHGI